MGNIYTPIRQTHFPNQKCHQPKLHHEFQTSSGHHKNRSPPLACSLGTSHVLHKINSALPSTSLATAFLNSIHPDSPCLHQTYTSTSSRQAKFRPTTASVSEARENEHGPTVKEEKHDEQHTATVWCAVSVAMYVTASANSGYRTSHTLATLTDD